VQRSDVQSFGDAQADALRWPLNRQEAMRCLEAFVTHALPHFGDYEDAMSSQAPRLFHSLLSFALNVKMLHPLEVLQCAEAAGAQATRRWLLWKALCARSSAGVSTSAASIGHICRATKVAMRWTTTCRFRTGSGPGTRICAVCSSPSSSRCKPHAHHIQRLMVIGNFALLAGLDPVELHRWYLGIYIDAFEWVELPNTLGMSQRADGGLIATKPYVSSAAYLQRMGDYCQGCAYNPKQKTGPSACPFNALYWDFFARHVDVLGSNHRLALVYRQWQKFPPEQQSALRAHAQQLREQLDHL
jgi:deoxyribodipyrimidine photolyase-related protein